MRKVELRPLDTNQPGLGQLVIIGWQGDNEGLAVDIQRNQDECFLQDDGEWRSNAFRFHLPALQPTTDGHLGAIVDGKIVDPLLANTHSTNMARVYGPDGTQVGQARLRLGKGLMPSGAQGSAPAVDDSAALDAPEPMPASEPPAAAVPEPKTEPAPQPAEEPPAEPQPEPESSEPPGTSEPSGKGKRWLWILLAALILVAIVAAAAWFGLYMRDKNQPGLDEGSAVEEEASATEAPNPEPTEEADPIESTTESAPQAPAESEAVTAAAPCSLQRMGEVGELEFIQACTGNSSAEDNMLEVIADARDNNHCGVARRLYAHQALNGDAAAALAYAQEFDPAQHSPSACFPEADAETAIFWYETALGLDADNAEASQRLEELQG